MRTMTPLNIQEDHFLYANTDGTRLEVKVSFAVKRSHELWEPIETWIAEHSARIVSESEWERTPGMLNTWAKRISYEPSYG